MNRILPILLILCANTVVNCKSDGYIEPGKNSMFVFGDSGYDPGNMAFLNISDQLPAANYYPYGRSYFATATGRLSDGLTTPDFIGIYAGVNISVAYLHPGVDVSEGANFATSGAGVLSEFAKTMNMDTQLEAFKNVTTKWTETFGSDETKLKLKNSVYLINLGGNDYFGYSDMNPNATEAQQQDRVSTVLSNFMVSIKEKIYKLGGRKFAIQNVGPLGCLPMMKQTHNMKCGDCVQLPSKLAYMHNVALAAAFAEFAADPAYPDVKYGIFDYYKILEDIIQNPSYYGFYVSKTGCCGSGMFVGEGCGEEPYMMCTNPGAYVFFDGEHTGQRTNNILAKLFWEGSEDFVKPYNIKQLFQFGSNEL